VISFSACPPSAVAAAVVIVSLLAQVLRHFTVAPVLPFDEPAAAVFAELVAQRVRVRTMDLRIAATALARGLVVLTCNASDFGQVPGLQIEDWTR